MNYLAKMTVYNFSKKKVKFDYAIIPVELDSTYKGKGIKMKTNSGRFVVFKKSNKALVIKKDEEKRKISRIVKLFSFSDEVLLADVERDINKTMYDIFNKKFWYKFKHRKTLKRKIFLEQFKI